VFDYDEVPCSVKIILVELSSEFWQVSYLPQRSLSLADLANNTNCHIDMVQHAGNDSKLSQIF
jgi:hypothetical protein